MNFNQRSFPLAGVFTILLMLSACAEAPGDMATSPSPAATETDSPSNQLAESDYPPEVIGEFLSSCTGGDAAMQQFCECSIEKIQQRYPFEEFTEMENDIAAGEDTPEAVMAIFEACQQ